MSSRWRPGALEGCALGLVLLAAVVAWKVAGSRYRVDVAVLCDGERLSGLSIRSDMGGVTQRVRARLSTARGNLFFSALRDLPIGARAERLRAEAVAAGLHDCPMAETYERLAAEAEYRRDIQRICSYVTFPGLADLDDEARLQTLADWIREDARSDRTRRLEAILQRGPTSADAAKALRDAASEIDVLTCDTAGLLDAPAWCAADAGAQRR